MMSPDRCSLDIAQAPLVRLQVLGDPRSDRCFTILRVHHLICDHQSLQFIVEEVMARLRGHESSLPAPVTLGNLVAQTIASVSPSDPEAFFQAKLADFDEPSAPFGLLDVRGDASATKEAKVSLDLDVALRLRAESKRLGISTARLLHAAWAIVAARTSGRDDVVFGTVLSIARHEDAGAGRALGMAVNTLPLRVRLQGLDARELVANVDRELDELRRFRSTPLTMAQRCSGVSGAAPLFTALLNYRRSAPGLLVESDVESGISVRARGEAWTNYPIALIVDDLGEAFTFIAQTDPRIDPDRILAYFHSAVCALTEALAEDMSTPALSLAVLPEDERRRVIEAFNATRTDYPRPSTIHRLFEEQVERTPNALAVQDDERALTYREINAKANRLARYLRSKGVGAQALVAICVERGVELVVGLLGIMKAGAAYVPLDPSYPFERLAYMIEDAAPPVLLTQSSLRDGLQGCTAQILALDEHIDEIAAQDADNLHTNEALSQHQLAYVIYTSGSTGKPKGVMVEHGAVVNFLLSMQREPGLAASDCLLAVTTISFDIAALELYLPLVAGAKVVLASRAAALDARQLIALMERFEVTVLQATPATWQMLIGSQWRGRSNLKALCGGEALTTELSAQLVRRVGALWNLYGPTETTIWSSARQIVEADQSAPAEPVGGPIANTQIYLLNGCREPVPIGVAGEIYIGGAGVARGYRNRQDLTAERFVVDPFSSEPQARMYKTGDLGRWRADGTIEYLGRNDYQVKIRGFRIELGEIEAQLARHEHIKEAAVVAREDAPGGKRLVAYIVPRESHDGASDLGAEDLRIHLRASLPDYMVPSAFVILDRMPLTLNGKLDRRALPLPNDDAYASREYVPPHGEVEESVAQIWQDLLRIDRIGRRDNFFELGGHSLLVMQAVARIESQWSIEVPIQSMFECPTLSEFAAHTEELRNSRLLGRIAAGGAEVEDLLETLASMSESRARELLRDIATEERS
jgi:amino acid adenylation domain-containing protein